MIKFIKKNIVSLMLTLIFGMSIILMQFLLDDLFSVWFLIAYFTFCGFAFFYSLQCLKSPSVFLHIVTAAVGCQFMSEIYFFCNTITYLVIPPNFSVSSLADLAISLFLFTAGYSAVKQSAVKKARYIIIAAIAPVIILTFTVIEFIYFKNINELIVCPGLMLASYSSMRQLIQPEDGTNRISSLRVFNLIILFLISFLFLFYIFTNLENFFMAGVFKMLEIVCIALLFPVARSGVEKWSS